MQAIRKGVAKLVNSLQIYVKDGGMTSIHVSAAIKELEKLGYQYRHDTFPELINTEQFKDNSLETPGNLAEALLWKLGKWKSYKKFAKQFADKKSVPTNTDVVFYAFAKHLRDNAKPIYDQHAIRAMWAICPCLTPVEKDKCKQILINKKDEWKNVGSGNVAVDCYNIYLDHIDKIIKEGVSKKEIDKLLMPLGQALKRCTKNYSEFAKLCKF